MRQVIRFIPAPVKKPLRMLREIWQRLRFPLLNRCQMRLSCSMSIVISINTLIWSASPAAGSTRANYIPIISQWGGRVTPFSEKPSSFVRGRVLMLAPVCGHYPVLSRSMYDAGQAQAGLFQMLKTGIWITRSARTVWSILRIGKKPYPNGSASCAWGESCSCTYLTPTALSGILARPW